MNAITILVDHFSRFLAVGALLGFLTNLLVADHRTDYTWLKASGRACLATLFGAILAALVQQSVESYYLVAKVADILDHPSPCGAAHDWASKQDGETSALFNSALLTLDSTLASVAKGELQVPRDDVFNIWREGFDLTRQGETIQATNLVSDQDWQFFGPEGGGRKTQKDAIARGVTVQRVMIVDRNDPVHVSGLEELAQLHRSVGVDVKEFDFAWIENNPAFQVWFQTLGTYDVVLFGDHYALLTLVDHATKSIIGSQITTDPQKVAAARSLFQRIWQDAYPPQLTAPPSSTSKAAISSLHKRHR